MADHDYKNGGWKNKYVIAKRCEKCSGTGCMATIDSLEPCDACDAIGSIAVDENAVYFVLRLDKDPHARKAALAYADSVEADNPQFAADIIAEIAAALAQPKQEARHD